MIPATFSRSDSQLLVLDTNVVLDWLLFGNPECAKLPEALITGQLRWVATAAMRDELVHVLASGALAARSPDVDSVWAQWNQRCVEVPAPVVLAPAPRLRCSDPDDQKFIDLAVACGARWLLSRDRAVLKLGRRLSEVGVEVATPGTWAARNSSHSSLQRSR